jgi:dTDP-4-amino-4,6-dideoxygalactose transaminase
LVVSVDALGHPADYPVLTRLCGDAGIPLLADSAPALGAYTGGVPVGTQADAHTFSLSMAKVVSAAGAGGFAVLPAGSRDRLEQGANWIRSSLMTEPNAVVALDQLPHIDAMLARRAAVAAVYDDFAHTLPGVIPQYVRTDERGRRRTRRDWTARRAGHGGVGQGRLIGVGGSIFPDTLRHVLNAPDPSGSCCGRQCLGRP